MEFVPMISHSTNKKWEFDLRLESMNTTWSNGECYMHKAPYCALEDFIVMLNDTRNELTTPMEYLFGLNEAWDNSSSKASLKFSTPHEMVRARTTEPPIPG